MKTKLLVICLLLSTLLSGCSSNSCDDSKPTSQWHDCSGTYVSKGKGTYSGEWKYGEMSGQGEIENADGGNYVGEFKNNKIHGHGVYTFSDGEKYVGEWKNNEKHGQGTNTYADGTKEVGQWKNGKYIDK